MVANAGQPRLTSACTRHFLLYAAVAAGHDAVGSVWDACVQLAVTAKAVTEGWNVPVEQHLPDAGALRRSTMWILVVLHAANTRVNTPDMLFCMRSATS